MRTAMMLCFRDMRKHWLLYVLVVVQMASCVVYLFVAIEQGRVIQAYGRYITTLQSANITTFHMHYNDDAKQLRITDELLAYLVDTLDDQESAYAFVPLELRVKGHYASVMVGLGNTQICTGRPRAQGSAWIGRKAKLFAPGDTIALADGATMAQIEDYLPDGIAYMHRSEMMSLDEWVYVEASLQDILAAVDPSVVERVFAAMALVDPTLDDVADHIRVTATSEFLSLKPASLSSVALKHVRDAGEGADFYKLIYGCVFLFAFIAVVINLLLLIRRNTMEYAVHRLYGATFVHILARSALQIALLLLVPLLVLCLALYAMPEIGQGMMPWVCAVYAVAVIALSAVPFIELRGHDFTRHVRGE